MREPVGGSVSGLGSGRLSIVAEAIRAYALVLLARESLQDFKDIVAMPPSTRLAEDLGLNAAAQIRIASRLRLGIRDLAPWTPPARLATIGDLVRNLAAPSALLH